MEAKLTTASKKASVGVQRSSVKSFFDEIMIDRYAHGASPPVSVPAVFAFPSGLDPGG